MWHPSYSLNVVPKSTWFGAPVKAGDRGCGHCSCNPAVHLCVGCENDAQLMDGVRGPLLGCRFDCHGVCWGWSCSLLTRSGSDDGLGDRWWLCFSD